MDFLFILFIAVGLAMDAFAVSVAVGIRLGCPATGQQTMRIAGSFGFFQFMMPVIGWFAGAGIGSFIAGFDHWVAFALLAYIGGRMIHESFEEERVFTSDPTRGLTLLSLSIATSLDAFAVGLTLGVLRGEIFYPSVVIGITAAAFTTAGIKLGCRIGMSFSRRMEMLGGLILIVIGLSILAKHLTA
jgi:putative Mn2+ efflux pump MntP